jgi:hypothetical protein
VPFSSSDSACHKHDLSLVWSRCSFSARLFEYDFPSRHGENYESARGEEKFPGASFTMLSSLVELLEEKGILKQEEWEKKVKQRISV